MVHEPWRARPGYEALCLHNGVIIADVARMCNIPKMNDVTAEDRLPFGKHVREEGLTLPRWGWFADASDHTALNWLWNPDVLKPSGPS